MGWSHPYLLGWDSPILMFGCKDVLIMFFVCLREGGNKMRHILVNSFARVAAVRPCTCSLLLMLCAHTSLSHGFARHHVRHAMHLHGWYMTHLARTVLCQRHVVPLTSLMVSSFPMGARTRAWRAMPPNVEQAVATLGDQKAVCHQASWCIHTLSWSIPTTHACLWPHTHPRRQTLPLPLRQPSTASLDPSQC